MQQRSFVVVVGEEVNGLISVTKLCFVAPWEPEATAPAAPAVVTPAAETQQIPTANFPNFVSDLELSEGHPRWVWADTSLIYPRLLASGITIARCIDLRLTHRILRNARWLAGSVFATQSRNHWDDPTPIVTDVDDGLFEPGELTASANPTALHPNALTEFHTQLAALRTADEAAAKRLWLLCIAESTGALTAAEMSSTGLPWRTDAHDDILTAALGPRPVTGYRPARLNELAVQIQEQIGVELNPDSPADLLRGLRRAGLEVASTRSWDIKSLDHPVAPLVLRYKKLSRLWTANGWHWLDTWVHDGRFRPVYIVGGVVTGRWASDGGGALQLPHQIRGAVLADDGWVFVVADAAQLEPRILAAMSHDQAMARAGQSTDMYEGIVATGAVETREHAKFGMLGAMYGGTQGVSGQVLPQLRRAFPAGIGLVERAAEVGERGGQVTTWLGRTSPLPGNSRVETQGQASGFDSDQQDAANARTQARSWGRFTRNFVVQGTAAEWALCWMALLRVRLRGIGENASDSPTLVFFLHDELIVHTPQRFAEPVATAVKESAVEAGRLLFGDTDVEFPLTVATVTNYGDAK